jgi:hypothetical protein
MSGNIISNVLDDAEEIAELNDIHKLNESGPKQFSTIILDFCKVKILAYRQCGPVFAMIFSKFRAKLVILQQVLYHITRCKQQDT